MARKPRKIQERYDVRGDNRYMSFLEDIRGTIRAGMEMRLMDVKTLAVEAHLHPNTIKAFLAGKTVQPQFGTVYRILEGVGVALTTKTPTPRRKKK